LIGLRGSLARGGLCDPLECRLQPVGGRVRIFAVAGHVPAPPQLPLELKAREALNVKQISAAGGRYPAVVVHGLANARAVLAAGRPVTLISAPGAALFAGCGWWRALVARVRAEFPEVPIDDILDCADASGLALGALRIGQRSIVLDPAASGRSAVAAIAASLGGAVLASRPPSLDMADRAAARGLHDWLQVRTTPGDSGDALG
jgi:hypothetical protein